MLAGSQTRDHRALGRSRLRGMAWLGSWESWWQDARLAARGLYHARGLAVVAVLMLAVSMAGAIVMFALIQGVLLRPLPVPAESELHVGWRALPEAGDRHWPFRATDLDVIRKNSALLEGVA